MNTTENRLLIIERPNDRKWPYVIGGFIAGVASIIGATYLFDDEGGDGPQSTEEYGDDMLGIERGVGDTDGALQNLEVSE